MFELPDAKRVRRQDLYDSSSDRHSSPEHEVANDAELRAKLNARLSNLLSLDLGSATARPAGAAEAEPTDEGHPPDGEGEGGKGEAEFEFRLFSTSGAAQKVVLGPDGAEATFDGPPISQRPISHYIRGELSPRERVQFQHAAVTGQDVLAWARQRAWGLEVPWRVTSITVVAGSGKGSAGGGTAEKKQQHPQDQQLLEDGSAAQQQKKKRRTRPGKKTRIGLRKREKAKKEAAAALERQKLSKEEHLREKKKRLNREKKLKRRQKEREKKLAARTAAGGDGGTLQSESEPESDGEE